jgi:diguanylate cyclase (GGDEF)-like protein
VHQEEARPEPRDRGAGRGPASNGKPDDPSPLEGEQDLADADQTAADGDQTAADIDQVQSDSDQARSDADQRSSDRDQTVSDRYLSEHPGPAEQRAHDVSKAERDETTAQRDDATFLRSQVTVEREAAAAIRDEMARLRDEAAEARDEAAEARDSSLRIEAQATGPIEERLDAALMAAAAARAEARKARLRAVADRERAASDRERAAEDRLRSAAELRRAHLDQLTGAYRREMGEVAIQHEIERARRTRQPLMLAYVDVDGLKAVNDDRGHAAGDALLRDVAEAIRSKLRPYDPMVRMGGDEFVCTFVSEDEESAGKRFGEIRAALGGGDAPVSVSVGFTGLRPEDSLEDWLARGDAALYTAKRDD